MAEQRDYARTAALALLAVVVSVGIGLTVYWTVAARFPDITLGGAQHGAAKRGCQTA
jgi:hypothetical protein